MADTNNQNGNLLVIVIVALIALVAGIYFLQGRESGEHDTKIERAADEISEGIDDARDEFKPEEEKSVGEKAGDALEDAGDDLKEATDGDGE